MVRIVLLVILTAIAHGLSPEGYTVGIQVRITTLDSNFPGGYQVAVADIDGDGRPDVLGLGEEVAWLANPSWAKYPVTSREIRGNIDIAPQDLDGDGKLEIVIASAFALNNSASGGNLDWFSRTGNLESSWIAHHIDAYPTTHRIRWADPEGIGRKVLISAPLMGRGATAPEYDQAPAPLFLYRVPGKSAGEPWPRQIIDDSLHMTHGLEILDFDHDGRDEILTASYEGVHLFHASGTGSGLKWSRTRLCEGEQATRPSRGSSEVRLGKLKSGRRFIATIEPWHGDQVVVYLEARAAGPWPRQSIDSSFNEGHALAVLDLDGDGGDEVLAGFRGKRRGVVAYRALDAAGTKWEQQVLDDGGIACQGFFEADLRATGRPAVVGIGGATRNVRLYEFTPVAR